jgi:hypothetical protein
MAGIGAGTYPVIDIGPASTKKERKVKEGTAMAFAAHDDINIVEVVLTHTGKEL